MLTNDTNKKRIYKILFDIIAILAIISFINILLALFNIKIPFLSYVGLPTVLAIILFVSMFTFAWRFKKWGWIILNSLIFIGFIMSSIAGSLAFQNYMQSLSNEERIAAIKSGELLTQLPETLGNQILYYGGKILFLIGFLSLILFYFLYYRKYLTGKLSLQNISKGKFTSEQGAIQNYQKKEKKLTKILTWIVILLLIFVVGGFIFYALTG